MHAHRVLETRLRRNCDFMHRARLLTVLKVVAGIFRGEKAMLTHIGRSLKTKAFEKHNIKCVDRLLGDAHLGSERLAVYQSIAAWVLSAIERPWSVVDWSDLEIGHEYLILRASVPIGGRAITLYEEVHPLKHYNSPKTHCRFLDHPRAVVPQRCIPVIVTDAGSRGPWFRAVESLGWDWIGRIRNSIKYFKPETGRWCYTHSLYKAATSRIRHIGWRCLSKRHRYECHLYLVRAYRRGPGRPLKRRSYGNNDGLYRKLHRAPWLLATSLPHALGNGKKVMRAYAQRMQIEETFRDLKNHRWGFALRYARTTHTERLEALLLIAVLASLLLWLIGLAAHACQWTRHFQANTEKRRAVLSTVFLGQQVWNSAHLNISLNDLADAFDKLVKLLAIRARFA